MDSLFWGIIPRKVSLPLGHIILPVQFGTAKHFHVDYINYLVADFNMAYHAILGRLALAKFMVVPHYVYLVLKISMEQGVLTLHANVSTAYDCEREGLAIAEAMHISARIEACIVDSKKFHTSSRL